MHLTKNLSTMNDALMKWKSCFPVKFDRYGNVRVKQSKKTRVMINSCREQNVLQIQIVYLHLEPSCTITNLFTYLQLKPGYANSCYHCWCKAPVSKTGSTVLSTVIWHQSRYYFWWICLVFMQEKLMKYCNNVHM